MRSSASIGLVFVGTALAALGFDQLRSEWVDSRQTEQWNEDELTANGQPSTRPTSSSGYHTGSTYHHESFWGYHWYSSNSYRSASHSSSSFSSHGSTARGGFGSHGSGGS